METVIKNTLSCILTYALFIATFGLLGIEFRKGKNAYGLIASSAHGKAYGVLVGLSNKKRAYGLISMSDAQCTWCIFGISRNTYTVIVPFYKHEYYDEKKGVIKKGIRREKVLILKVIDYLRKQKKQATTE